MKKFYHAIKKSSILVLIISNIGAISLNAACDASATMRMCGATSQGNFLVICGFDLSVTGLVKTEICTGDSNGEPVEDVIYHHNKSNTGKTEYYLPGLCSYKVILTGTCCGGAKTVCNSTHPIIVSKAVWCIFG
jgi:hypothetical protein